MPPCPIHPRATHPGRRALNNDAALAQAALEIAPASRLRAYARGCARNKAAPVGGVEGTVKAAEKVEVVVERGGGGKAGARDVGGRVALAGALGAGLVPLVAWQRASAGRAARAEVSGWSLEAFGRWLVCVMRWTVWRCDRNRGERECKVVATIVMMRCC